MKSEETGLTEKQEAFCQFYAQLSDTYNNGTWSYALAFGHDLENADRTDFEVNDKNEKIIGTTSYDKMANMCAVGATRLLRIAKIIERITNIKATHIDDDKIVDSRLMDIIQAGQDKDAMAAIKHRNDLKQRVTKKIKLDTEDPIKALINEYVGVTDDRKADEAVSGSPESQT